MVLLLLPLSLAIDHGEYDHGGGDGGGGGSAAAAVAAVAVVDNNWRQKRPATRALRVAQWHAMAKANSGQQRINQPTMGAAKMGSGGGGDGNSNGSSNDGNNGGSGGGKDNGGNSDSNGDVLPIYIHRYLKWPTYLRYLLDPEFQLPRSPRRNPT